MAVLLQPPPPQPCLCFAPPRPSPQRAPCALHPATEHVLMLVATIVLCPDVLLLSRLASPSRPEAERSQRPKPANWRGMTKAQRENWRRHTRALVKLKRWYRWPCTGALRPSVPEQQALSWNQLQLAARVRPPRPSNWGDMSRRQRQQWKLSGGGTSRRHATAYPSRK